MVSCCSGFISSLTSSFFIYSDALANISFVLPPTSTAAELYDQCIHDLSCVLDRHAPFICGKIMKKTSDWLPDSFRKPKSIRRQFEPTMHKDRSQVSRTKLQDRLLSAVQSSTETRLNPTALSLMTKSRDPKKLW